MFENVTSTGIHQNVTAILSGRRDIQGKSVIDLACGDGRTTYLLRNFGATVTPYDILPESYKLSDKAKYANTNESLPIESESADIVILQEVIEHLPNQLFALQEIYRVLKNGGELFLTTPNRSCLVSKLAFMCFESEHLRGTPVSAVDSVWGQDETGTKKYYGHLFLIGIQQLRTLAMVAGFKSIEVKRSDLSTSSLWLMLPFYPIILLVSLFALGQHFRKSEQTESRAEKLRQFWLNINPKYLTSKYLIAYLVK